MPSAGTEIAWGRLDGLEAFCIEHGLAFAVVRCLPGAWEAKRLVFDGAGEPRFYTATTNDVLVITAPEARSLGSFMAFEASGRRRRAHSTTIQVMATSS
ncbi:hypothetical protein [Flavisphingomonas formosensis]|uniref:hypothetical protein n=1 Tax=Flavisphingomonas formosensis TaxID=861534 RepID=UPI0018DF5A0A|nr:hypothetical protein [Sphingomonas formosensis]